MTTLTAQQIACVYAWLAQLFSRELDDEQLTQIASAIDDARNIVVMDKKDITFAIV